MKHFNFLLADDIHIHERNFGSLFRYIESKNIKTNVHTDHKETKTRQGSYGDEPWLGQYLAKLESLSAEELFEFTHDYIVTPIRVFPLCRAEALAYGLATRDHWHDEPVDASEREVFERLHARDRDVLLQNMAAAMFWIDEYRGFLEREPAPYTHAFVFSGSMIYTRVLMEVLRFYRTKVIVLESIFTGKEFYLEERYEPIANASDIRFPTVRDAIVLPAEPVARMRETAKAVQRIFRSQNKNVTQPSTADIPRFPEPERPLLLIVGQVANDFSIIEQRRGYLSSIAFYRELIRRVLEETSYNVIFKGHPWEHQKTHLRRPLTKEKLAEFASGLPDELRSRFALREHDNIVLLGRVADRAVMLNSQAGVELAFHCGLRPGTFGRAFYGGAGFTDDYVDLDSFIQDVRGGRTRALLDLDDYDALLEWLTRFLQNHVITEFASGVKQIEKRLEVTEISWHVPRDSAQTQQQSAARKGRRSVLLDKLLDFRTARKLRKLWRNPRGFFRDAKIVRSLRGE